MKSKEKRTKSNERDDNNAKNKKIKSDCFLRHICGFCSLVRSFFDARSSPSPHKLYSCLCYSVLFPSDNIFSPFYSFFFVFDLLRTAFVLSSFFFHSFFKFNSLHVYGVTPSVCVCACVGWLVGYDKKAMCLRQFLMSRLLTDAIHITIHTHLSSFSRYAHICVLCIVNLCSLASIAMAIIMRDDDDECIHKTLHTCMHGGDFVDAVDSYRFSDCRAEPNSVERFTLTECNPFN